jgi:putative FmdB family regulatory protein
MPIYEFACPKCRRIFSFLSKRVNPTTQPRCPQCGSSRLVKEMSRFAMLKGVPEPAAPTGQDDGGPEAAMPDFDDPRVERAMSELERDMEHMDENNPRHMAHMLKKMKEAMPPGALPREMDIAIRRLEQGEDPEKIEQDMGDVLGGLLGDEEGDGAGGMGGGYGGGYSRDPGLYDY